MKKATALLLFLCPILLNAQDHVFRGSVADTAGELLPYVTVIIQNADSVVVEAVLTDSEGYFKLQTRPSDNDIVIVQHLSYETVVRSGFELMNRPQIIMAEKSNAIDGVVVKGERPLVTLVGNTLSYDARELAKNRIVNNAFEMVKELPGITGGDDELQLIGAGKFTIVINGQITSMTLPQLFALLKSISADQVKRLNVSYNAPAKYNFNGAVIEVELDDNKGYEGTTGELSANYVNEFYSAGNMRGSLNVEKEKYSLNFLAQGGAEKKLSDTETYSRHYLGGEYYDIYQNNRQTGKPVDYSLRGSGDFRLNNDARLNLSYYYSGRNSNVSSMAGNDYRREGTPIRNATSDNTKKTNSHLHNLHLQYDGVVTAGADYTRFNNPDKGRFFDTENGITQDDYRYEFSQKVDKFNVFVNKTSGLEKWQLSYGLNFTTAGSDNNSDYIYSFLQGTPYTATPTTISSQSEYFANGFFEVSTQLSPKANLKIGIKGEYQYANIKNNGDRQNLWSEWTVYPDMSLSYVVSQNHILQFNITSDKSYPPYWALSANESQLNSYAYIYGNPNLKPSREYEAQLSYILKNKYVVMAFGSYRPDRFAQMPYQSQDELKMIYEFLNFDFQAQYGFAVIVPFKIGNFLSSRIVVNGVEMVDRIKDFHGINIRNNIFLTVVSINNSAALYHGKKSKFDLQVDGRYQGPAIQGIMKIGESYTLNAGIKWTLKDKLSASARWDNILRRQTPRPIVVDWGSQYTSMRDREFGKLTLNLTWKFGQYKEKDFRKVDSSRFGKN